MKHEKQKLIDQLTEVHAFETTDGGRHLTRREAMEVQNRLNLASWYDNGYDLSALYGGNTQVFVSDLADFLIANKTDLLKFLNASIEGE